MRLKALIMTLALATAAAGTVGAGEIYKWVDAEGNVHYGDRPTGATSEQRLAIQSRPTDPNVIQQQVQARLDNKAAAAEAAANEPQGPSKEELLAEARQRNEKCTMYRQRLERFTNSRHLYREDENGERTYLDEAEMLSAREKVLNQVADFCDS